MFLYFTQIRAWPLAALLLFMLAGCAGAPRSPDVATDTASDALAALELRNGGRLGVFVLDAGSGRSLGWREDERFGMCSTFKLLLAATVLDAERQGRLDGTARFVGNIVMGVVFGIVYARTRRVMPLVIAHTLLDVVAFVGYTLLRGHLSWL
ncbi:MULTISPECIES: CPBP family intramembrane glutamic endopeptidase [Pseudomonas]|uniref:CPBP family intramembrane glutamic endopeptidase n=1 Tax=Pseudomonas TaxID=286 RepID=UPI00197D088A|nr:MULTISPECIES: CPBP family intramembrane glutamic endopeptidase [Pseudomonas]HCU1950156.1 serine hydrolase [Pseudomonas aeruginosa]